ncbi:hypothetical protein BD413DRAFT_231340 [Trametes elegans]|nr:hypothetical protein BD413DRAFT_231340 [Trametes elegans]
MPGTECSWLQLGLFQCQNSTIQLKPLNSSTSFLGEPPYFMMALEVEGITTVTPIGDDPAHLSWQNTHRRNAALLLTVMDSAGNTGGFPVSFFNVIAASAGADTSCLIPAPTASTSRITPNVTTTIETCEPWGLTITGGTKPYSVTLAQIASGVITNVTMGPEDDVFTFIDRADPDRQLMAGVVDATGQWGISTIAVNTHGSTNTDCVGLISTSKTKAQIQAQASDAAVAKTAAAQRAHTTTVALGIIFGLVVPLLIGAGFLGWWWLRRRRRLAAVHTVGANGPRSAGPAGDIFADPLYDPEHQHQDRPTLNIDMAQVGPVQRVSSQRHRTASWAVDGASSIGEPTPVSAYPPPDGAGTHNRRTDSPTSIDMTSAELAQATPTPFLTPATVQYGPPPNSTSPAATLSPEVRYRKALEAHAEALAARARVAAARQSAVAGPSGEGAGSPGPSAGAGAGGAREKRQPVQRSQSLGMGVGVGGVVAAAALASASAGRMFPAQPLQRRGAGSASFRMPPLGESGSEAEEERARPNIIIQHRDGGVVEELPPPYLDTFARSRPGTPRAPRRLGTA